MTFESVVRTGTFAAAARELGYTQPGVSQQIRALERDLGATLFTRSGRALKLSEEGEVLASRVHALLSDLRAAEEHVATVARLREGSLRVCAFPSANATLVPTAMSRMRQEHLGVDIELSEAEPPESIEGLLRGTYDMVVSFRYDGDLGGESDEIVSIPLMRDPLVLLLPDTHPLARRQRVPLDELSDERWVAGCVRCRQEFVNACHNAGFAPRIDITTDDNLAAQSYVVSGLGLAMMPQMVQSFVRHPRLRIRQVDPVRSRLVTVSLLRANHRSAAVRHMVESLRWAAAQVETMADQ